MAGFVMSPDAAREFREIQQKYDNLQQKHAKLKAVAWKACLADLPVGDVPDLDIIESRLNELAMFLHDECKE